MAYKVYLGMHTIQIGNKEDEISHAFLSSDNYRQCLVTGAKEFFLHHPDGKELDSDIVEMRSKGILKRYSFDLLNLYLVDLDASNYFKVSSEEDFIKIFNDPTATFGSFSNFISILKNTHRYFRYYGFYMCNKELVKKLFYGQAHKDDNKYQEDFYSSEQEFVEDRDFQSHARTDVIGEIKTKTFHGSIRKHT